YLLDTHTAVALNVYEKYHNTSKDDTVTIIASTASPYKFGGSVAKAIIPEKIVGLDEFAILKLLAKEVNIAIPKGIKDIDKKTILHRTVTQKDDLQATVLNFLDFNNL
ncbi:MAG: threonine synthase, partial [Syntrophomonadaceae bacterium]|nr:threonine synthase [Syntrophomonadaceae bacterium]